MRIGITDCFKEDKYKLYVRWIQNVEPDIDIVKLSHREKNSDAVSAFDGLLLTGGGDVHPRHYNEEAKLPYTEGVDEQRDDFEFDVIHRSLDTNVPIFGICRGMQVMNVYLGGSLVPDLLREGFDSHADPKNPEKTHPITIDPHSLLTEVAGATEAVVNSHHHQAVKKLGRGLVASAVSSDGVFEAAEWVIKEGMPFLMLVQWHPERAPHGEFSRNLASLFLREVQHSKRTKATTH